MEASNGVIIMYTIQIEFTEIFDLFEVFERLQKYVKDNNTITDGGSTAPLYC